MSFFLASTPNTGGNRNSFRFSPFFSLFAPITRLRYKLKCQKNIFTTKQNHSAIRIAGLTLLTWAHKFIRSQPPAFMSAHESSAAISVIRAAANREKTLGHPTVWPAAKQSPAQLRIELRIQSRQSREVVSGHKCWTLRFEKINCANLRSDFSSLPEDWTKELLARFFFLPNLSFCALKMWQQRDLRRPEKSNRTSRAVWRLPQSDRKRNSIDDRRASSIEWKLQGQ